LGRGGRRESGQSVRPSDRPTARSHTAASWPVGRQVSLFQRPGSRRTCRQSTAIRLSFGSRRCVRLLPLPRTKRQQIMTAIPSALSWSVGCYDQYWPECRLRRCRISCTPGVPYPGGTQSLMLKFRKGAVLQIVRQHVQLVYDCCGCPSLNNEAQAEMLGYKCARIIFCSIENEKFKSVIFDNST
jgi:hypothetical protein